MEVDKVLERLDFLIGSGNTVLSSCSLRERGIDVDAVGVFSLWRTSSLSFLNAFPPDYIYYREFEARCKDLSLEDVEHGMGVLQAARDDIEGGYLQKVETLVSAKVFNDFLEMAEHLLDNGYKDPAASLTGAVLEDGLRRICGNNDVTVKSDDNISSLNKKLADKRSVYNRLKQREIEVWNKLRDYADHGHFKQYTNDDVKNMLEGVRNFLDSQLG
ncbi:MAG: HEPN domain-containing protein [Dehalococcoidia bacterium]|nr:MAG: HEPN domain-containing protein [Dehalococcoidia bacterium]